MLRIPFKEVQNALKNILISEGFSESKSELISEVHTQSSCDGVFSHGLNRFPRFIEYVRKGLVDPQADPEVFQSSSAIEQWDGKSGSGICNAWKSIQKACEIAELMGIGLIALKNTNHWMRGGTYGWKAVESGKIAICFTNTQPNMPPWGGRESRTGNNPLIMAIPRKNGEHMVLDMSLSQYSFGKMYQYQLEGKKLSFPAGWDQDDNLSNDPQKILQKERALPIGYWKGSALSIMLDTLATVLSFGNSTYKIGKKNYETGVSQVFICLDPARFGSDDQRESMIKEIIENIHNVEPMNPGQKTRYPGENTPKIRRENLEKGVPVNEKIWEEIQALK
jgi:3-dehydro-L-gulonate 2-dehydrogenase